MKNKEKTVQIVNYVIQEFKDRVLLDRTVFEEEFGTLSFDEVTRVVENILLEK